MYRSCSTSGSVKSFHFLLSPRLLFYLFHQENVDPTQLVPYLCEILKTLSQAYSNYHQGNILFCLYDATESLARSIGCQLNKPDYIALLLPPLITKFNELMDDDEDLAPLMKCLSSVAVALQSGFLPHFQQVFDRSITIVANSQQQVRIRFQKIHQIFSNIFVLNF